MMTARKWCSHCTQFVGGGIYHSTDCPLRGEYMSEEPYDDHDNRPPSSADDDDLGTYSGEMGNIRVDEDLSATQPMEYHDPMPVDKESFADDSPDDAEQSIDLSYDSESPLHDLFEAAELDDDELTHEEKTEILRRVPEAAADIVTEGRETHGDALDNHDQIAEFWTTKLKFKGKLKEGEEITGRDVAEMMIQLKLSRADTGVPSEDHYRDICGYATISNLWSEVNERSDDSESTEAVVREALAGRVDSDVMDAILQELESQGAL